MDAEVLETCDSIVSLLNATLPDSALAETVFIGIADTGKEFLNFRIFVYPMKYTSSYVTTHRKVFNHRIAIKAVKKVPDFSDPKAAGTQVREWVRECINFVRTNIYDVIEASRMKIAIASSTGNPENNRKGVIQDGDVSVYDPEALAKEKLFVCEYYLDIEDHA